jgi:transcriptional regulator with AAA-type ATPase domain
VAKAKQPKAIYITWHYSTHGMAYLKHILTAFYLERYKIGDAKSDYLSQDELQYTWDEAENRQPEKGFLFEKVFYLTCSDEVNKQISWRRRPGLIEKDELMVSSGTMDIWKVLHEHNQIEANELAISEEAAKLEELHPTQWPNILKEYWRSIQYYRVEDQWTWWHSMSNGRYLYDKNRIEKVVLPVQNLRDIQDIANHVRTWLEALKRKYKDYTWVINTSLGSYEAQTIWYALGEAGFLPPNTHFISTYDDKSRDSHKRFKPFVIARQPVNIFSDIRQKHLNVYENDSLSQSRKLANAKFNHYLNQGFTMLLLGERGTGKTRLIQENKSLFTAFTQANCASFDDDSKAETELFGYAKNAFTGAGESKVGLFQAANGGLLFLDEVHNLSPRVQAKLMTALQTNDKNQFQIRKLGDLKETTVTCTVVFASNQPIEKLREILYPDLFDRITQLIIEFPPLRESGEERVNDWKTVWTQLRFDKIGYDCPNDDLFLDWLKRLPLYGNYRDLQKIAIFYKAFLELEKGENLESLALIKSTLKGKQNAFEFAKSEFEKYYSRNTKVNTHLYFDAQKTVKEMETVFKKDMATWIVAQFEDKEKAAAHFGLTTRSLFNWLHAKPPKK